MFFNSVEFALFFPLVFILYWAVFQKKQQSPQCLYCYSKLFFLRHVGLALPFAHCT